MGPRSRSGEMSINPLKLLDMAWSKDAPFSTVTRAVYTRLVLRANSDDGWCFTSQRRIAADTRLGLSTVNRSLDALEEAGWIVRERAPRPAATRYRILPQGEYPTGGISHSGSQILPERELDTPTVGHQLPQELPHNYSELFEVAWKAYPKRPNNSKAAARKAWSARVKAGVDPQRMLDGTRRYAEYIRLERIEPRFVKHASTFFGPGEHYNNDFDIGDPDEGADRAERVEVWDDSTMGAFR